MRMKGSLLILARCAGAGLIIMTLAAGCDTLSALKAPELPPAEAEAGRTAVKTVKFETVKKQLIEMPVAVPAEVRSSVQMEAVALTGGTVEQVLKRIGDAVAEGETIALLSSEEALLANEQARSAWERANSALSNARRENANMRRQLDVEVQKMELQYEELQRQLNKLRNDYDRGEATLSDVRAMEIQVEGFAIDLDLAKQQLRSLGSSAQLASLQEALKNAELALARSEEAIANLEVKSPIDGLITALTLVEGAKVGANASVARIEKVNPVRIVAQLPEEAAAHARGKTELMYIAPEIQGTASISYLASVMNPQTKTYEIGLEADDADGKLKPGMAVSLVLSEDEEQTVVAVPQYSVMHADGKHEVFVLLGDKVEKRTVQLGRSNPYYYEVISGLEEGERIIVTGQLELRDGEQVKAEASTVEQEAESKQ